MMPRLKYKWHFVLVLLCLAGLIFTPVTGQAQPGTAVRVDPASVMLNPGESEVIEIWVDDVVGLRAFDIHVQFDPTRLSADQLTDAEFIPGLFEASTNGVDNEAGLVKFGVVQGNVDPQSGSGVLFSFEITAKDLPGKTHLSITLAELVGEDYFLISCETSRGIVQISGEPVPVYEAFLPLILK